MTYPDKRSVKDVSEDRMSIIDTCIDHIRLLVAHLKGSEPDIFDGSQEGFFRELRKRMMDIFTRKKP